jgi:hypothetical protein
MMIHKDAPGLAKKKTKLGASPHPPWIIQFCNQLVWKIGGDVVAPG